MKFKPKHPVPPRVSVRDELRALMRQFLALKPKETKMVKHYINEVGTPVTSYKTKYGEGNSVLCSVEQNSDLSWTTLRYDDDRVHHDFTEKDDKTFISFGCTTFDESLPLNSIHIDLTHKSINVSIWGGNVTVTAYPEHPNYENFNVPEEEVEPSPSEEDPVMGKVLFKFCFSNQGD